MPPIQEVPTPSRRVPSPALLGFLLLVVLVSAGGWVWYEITRKNFFSKELLKGEDVGDIRDLQKENEQDPVLSGTLLLTLREKGASTFHPYAYDFETGNLLRVESVGDTAMNITPSPDASQAAFSARRGDIRHIVVIESGREYAVSYNTLAFKREPRWSSDGTRIAYVATDARDAHVAHQAEGWSVYVARADGSGEEYVGAGYAPVFSPDGRKVLFIRADGLYLFDLEDKTSKKVWEIVGGDAHSHMKLSLSPDFSTLAWSDHHGFREAGVLALFTIDSWEPFSMSPSAHLITPAVFSAFSPDGSRLAFQTAVATTTPAGAALLYPKIFLYSLRTGAMAAILDLDGFDPSFLWVDAWTQDSK